MGAGFRLPGGATANTLIRKDGEEDEGVRQQCRAPFFCALVNRLSVNEPERDGIIGRTLDRTGAAAYFSAGGFGGESEIEIRLCVARAALAMGGSGFGRTGAGKRCRARCSM